MQTGIFRRIDDLGRIVIPKEARKKLHIDVGDMLEISVADHKVILTPYTPLSDTKFIIETCFKALAENGTLSAIVTLKHEGFMSRVSELPKYTALSAESRNLLYQRKEYVSDGSCNVRVSEYSKLSVLALFPIKKFGELYGSLIIVGNEHELPNEVDVEKGRLLADIISAAVSDFE